MPNKKESDDTKSSANKSRKKKADKVETTDFGVGFSIPYSFIVEVVLARFPNCVKSSFNVQHPAVSTETGLKVEVSYETLFLLMAILDSYSENGFVELFREIDKEIKAQPGISSNVVSQWEEFTIKVTQVLIQGMQQVASRFRHHEIIKAQIVELGRHKREVRRLVEALSAVAKGKPFPEKQKARRGRPTNEEKKARKAKLEEKSFKLFRHKKKG